MIRSRKDYKYYLEADRIAKGLPKSYSFKGKVKNILFRDHVWRFQKLMRKIEYYRNCKTGPLAKLIKFYLAWKMHRLSIKLGFTIPTNIFGPGLSIAHPGTLLISMGSKIGKNCRVHTGVSVATSAGYADVAPIIGDNVYIGPGVKMFGDIYIADGTAIGANSVVTKSVLEPNTMIAGVPAKKIADIDISDFIILATDVLDGISNQIEMPGVPTKIIKEKLKNNQVD